ncbi:N-acyl homoserine lactonase family protein [Paenibacillus segetis]|uniref:Metallo-beta-lactamase domain-containing protein n=1 Tax=Paenibacillus segetis TaxID=1325360 RepID=A0ABQ1YDJ8_9BACL|nr:N-acyl homoserine lactonase family protein [Paenibacillus segetis]GGH20774.1 hypothetical protein GCM10008013_18310 [Paenibacillus segetis]
MHQKIKIHVLQTGKVKVDEALPFHTNSLNPLGFTGIFRSEDHKIWMPVSVYLIEHPKGLILFDTGWSSSVRNVTKAKKNVIFGEISVADLPTGKAIDEQLLALGYTSKDLDYIILSHLDGDHAGGLQLVKDAKNVLVSREELEASKGWSKTIRYNSKLWEGIKLQPFDFENSGIGPMGRSFDLFNDGSLQLIWTPGHSKGLTSLKVRNECDEYVLLVADTGYARKSWKKLIIPGISINKKHALQSLKWVKEMANQQNCIDALANHDPDVEPHTITL